MDFSEFKGFFVEFYDILHDGNKDSLVYEAGLTITKESGRLWDDRKTIPISGDAREMIFYFGT